MKRITGFAAIIMLAFSLQACNDSTIFPDDRVDDGIDITDDSTKVTISEILNLEWRLVGFQQQVGNSLRLDKVPNDQNFTLSFTNNEGGGMADCKGYTYQYTSDKNGQLSFFDPAPQIALVCPPESYDGRFYNAMESAFSYEATNATLHIYYGNQNETQAMYFVRKSTTSNADPVLLYPTIEAGGPDIVEIPPGDPYKILQASIVEDEMQIKVQYGGGCKEHDFSMVISIGEVIGVPNTAIGYLRHEAYNDACEALITEDLVYDLTPFKEQWKQLTGKSDGTIEITINDLHTGNVMTLSYVIGSGSNVEDVKDLIKGEWKWSQSWNPWTNQTTTPASEGYTERRQFTEDGIMKVWRDGVLQSEANYELSYKQIGGTTQQLTLQLTPGGNYWLEISQGNLKFISSPWDGIDMWFVR